MKDKKDKLKVAIIGSGNIGTDLLVKCLRSDLLDCTYFIGRNFSSPGISKASSLGVRVSDQSIQAIVNDPDSCDLVFDATSARDAANNWAILKPMNKVVIDMTPAKIGIMCIPAVNLDEAIKHQNINMVTCGGQASTPIAYVIGKELKNIEYIEVVSSIASRSAGPATRANLDDREMKLQAILELSLFEFSADVEEICDQVGVGRRCQAEVTIDLRMRAHAAVGDERGENGAGLEGARRAVGDCVLGVGAVQGGLRGLFAVAVGVCFLYYARAACVRCYRFSS